MGNSHVVLLHLLSHWPLLAPPKSGKRKGEEIRRARKCVSCQLQVQPGIKAPGCGSWPKVDWILCLLCCSWVFGDSCPHPQAVTAPWCHPQLIPAWASTAAAANGALGLLLQSTSHYPTWSLVAQKLSRCTSGFLMRKVTAKWPADHVVALQRGLPPLLTTRGHNIKIWSTEKVTFQQSVSKGSLKRWTG